MSWCQTKGKNQFRHDQSSIKFCPHWSVQLGRSNLVGPTWSRERKKVKHTWFPLSPTQKSGVCAIKKLGKPPTPEWRALHSPHTVPPPRRHRRTPPSAALCTGTHDLDPPFVSPSPPPPVSRSKKPIPRHPDTQRTCKIPTEKTPEWSGRSVKLIFIFVSQTKHVSKKGFFKMKYSKRRNKFTPSNTTTLHTERERESRNSWGHFGELSYCSASDDDGLWQSNVHPLQNTRLEKKKKRRAL